jgi:hypothetical protein
MAVSRDFLQMSLSFRLAPGQSPSGLFGKKRFSGA